MYHNNFISMPGKSYQEWELLRLDLALLSFRFCMHWKWQSEKIHFHMICGFLCQTWNFKLHLEYQHFTWKILLGDLMYCIFKCNDLIMSSLSIIMFLHLFTNLHCMFIYIPVITCLEIFESQKYQGQITLTIAIYLCIPDQRTSSHWYPTISSGIYCSHSVMQVTWIWHHIILNSLCMYSVM